MQIGFVALGKMGGNMVTRIRRSSEHKVVAFDFSADAVRAAGAAHVLVPAVDDHVARGHQAKQLVDRFLGRLTGRDHDPHRAWRRPYSPVSARGGPATTRRGWWPPFATSSAATR